MRHYSSLIIMDYNTPMTVQISCLMHTPPEHITELAYIYVTTTEQRPLLRLIAQLYQKYR